MAKGPRWRVQFRRKREGKTDYRQRLKQLRSGRPRLVVRHSLKHVRAQIVLSAPSGDLTVASACSTELPKFGWKAHTSNIPCAYLVGLLCGYRALESGAAEAVLDIGMHAPRPGAKVFAALKGAIDAGMQIPHGDVLPSEERIRGEHIKRYAEMLRSEGGDAHSARFSMYLARGLRPEELPAHFDEVKRAIAEHFGG